MLITERPAECVTLLKLNRPERLNAFDLELLQSLHDAVDAVDADHETRAVVITGEGRGFSAGLDLIEGHFLIPGSEDDPTETQLMLLQKRFTDLLEKVHASPKVFVAAVNGAATGFGFALALACDIRTVGPHAKFGAPFLKLGAVNTDLGISYFLPRYVGAGRSAEILLTGRLVPAEEALRIGIATHEGDGLELAASIAQAGAFQLWMTKETMWQTVDAPSCRHAIDMENRTQILMALRPDVDEAFAAFQNKGSES